MLETWFGPNPPLAEAFDVVPKVGAERCNRVGGEVFSVLIQPSQGRSHIDDILQHDGIGN